MRHVFTIIDKPKSAFAVQNITGKMICGLMKQESICSRNTDNRAPRVAQKGHILPTSKHHPGGKVLGEKVEVWACFTASRPGPLLIISGKMISPADHDLSQDNVRSPFCLKLSRGMIIENSDPKH